MGDRTKGRRGSPEEVAVPLFIKTISFRSQFVFNPSRDDPVINEVLAEIQEGGGTVRDISVASAGNFGAFVATYVISYEASGPIDVENPATGNGAILLLLAGGFALLLGLVVFGLIAAQA